MMQHNIVLDNHNKQGEFQLNLHLNMDSSSSSRLPQMKKTLEPSEYNMYKGYENDDDINSNEKEHQHQQQLNVLTQAIHLLAIIVASSEEDTELQADTAIDHLNQSWKLEQTGFPRLYNACKQMKEHLRLSSMEADQSILCIHQANQKTIIEQKRNDKLKRVIYKLVKENRALQGENGRLQSELEHCKKEKKVLKQSLRDHINNMNIQSCQYRYDDGGYTVNTCQAGELSSSCELHKVPTSDDNDGVGLENGSHHPKPIPAPSPPLSPITANTLPTLRLAKREKPKRSISRSVMNYVKSFRSEKDEEEEVKHTAPPSVPELTKKEEQNYDIPTDGESIIHDDDSHEYHIVTPTITRTSDFCESPSACSAQDCSSAPSMPCMSDVTSTTKISTLLPVPLENNSVTSLDVKEEAFSNHCSSSSDVSDKPPSVTSTTSTASEDGDDSHDDAHQGQNDVPNDGNTILPSSVTENGDSIDDQNNTGDLKENTSDEFNLTKADDVKDGDSSTLTSDVSTPETKSMKSSITTLVTTLVTSPLGLKEEKQPKPNQDSNDMHLTKTETYEIKFENNNIGLQFLPIRDPSAAHTIFFVCGYQGFNAEAVTKPKFGARLIKVGTHDLEQERWIMLDLISFLKKNHTTPFTMCFRNDPVSQDHREKLKARYRRNES